LTYLERQKCYDPDKKILFKKQLFDLEVKGQGTAFSPPPSPHFQEEKQQQRDVKSILKCERVSDCSLTQKKGLLQLYYGENKISHISLIYMMLMSPLY
jgi:hypothetical protein